MYQLIKYFIDLLEALRPLRSLRQVDISAADWTGDETRAIICEGSGLLKVDAGVLGTGILVPVAAGVPICIGIVKIYKVGTTVEGYIVAGS